MRQKKAYADEHRTYEAKGWFACELEDGTVAEACREQEEAKGNQGVPREMLLYSSLMEDFDAFLSVDEPIAGADADDQKEEENQEEVQQDATGEPQSDALADENQPEDEDRDSLLDELLESWPAALISFGILSAVGVIIALRRRKRAE